ncbi:MAG TPA: helix-turn-helix domain-containing protein [Polyangiaceae bacterium]|nr:helix-turn-helix domain-containing protein [Polyangiaceae bacterium]
MRTDVYAALESLTIQASGASTAKQAMQCLPLGFDLLLVNADSSDGALELVDAAFSLRQPPTIVVTGTEPDPRCVFELAKAGAHAYLIAPVSAAAVHACLRGFSVSAHLMNLVRPLVGHVGMKEIQACVRRALLVEALARSNGSRRSAAQLLGVTRPAIQKWLRSLAADELSPSEARAPL